MYQIKKWNTGLAVKDNLLFTPHLIRYQGETIHKSEFSMKFQKAGAVGDCFFCMFLTCLTKKTDNDLTRVLRLCNC